jgi:hypothetical protein
MSTMGDAGADDAGEAAAAPMLLSLPQGRMAGLQQEEDRC